MKFRDKLTNTLTNDKDALKAESNIHFTPPKLPKSLKE